MEEVNEYERLKQEKEAKSKELRKKIYEAKLAGNDSTEELEKLREEYKNLSLAWTLAQRRGAIGSDEDVRKTR